MKIRHGFVSNSSSSSFSVPLKYYKSTADVALAMLPFRDGYDEDKSNKANEELATTIKKQIKDGLIKPTTPLSFPSCNYDTYIIQKGDYYLISTCHNHPYYNTPHFQRHAPPEALALVGATDDEDLEYKVRKGNDFWFITYWLFGQESGYSCPTCFLSYLAVKDGPLKGRMICPHCISKLEINTKTK